MVILVGSQHIHVYIEVKGSCFNTRTINIIMFSGIPSSVTGTGSPLTPSARIHALNIVGDLLRKVGVSNRLIN